MTDAKALAAELLAKADELNVEARRTNHRGHVDEHLYRRAAEVVARLARVEEALRPLAELHVSQVAHDQVVFTTIPEGASDWTKNKSIRYSDIIRARDALSAALSEVTP